MVRSDGNRKTSLDIRRTSCRIDISPPSFRLAGDTGLHRLGAARLRGWPPPDIEILNALDYQSDTFVLDLPDACRCSAAIGAPNA